MSMGEHRINISSYELMRQATMTAHDYLRSACSAVDETHATTVSQLSSQNFLSLFNTNLEGCWNWWGYGSDPQFLTKQGVQISAIWSMVLRVTGQLN
jgi:hypothetical protein